MRFPASFYNPWRDELYKLMGNGKPLKLDTDCFLLFLHGVFCMIMLYIWGGDNTGYPHPTDTRQKFIYIVGDTDQNAVVDWYPAQKKMTRDNIIHTATSWNSRVTRSHSRFAHEESVKPGTKHASKP